MIKKKPYENWYKLEIRMKKSTGFSFGAVKQLKWDMFQDEQQPKVDWCKENINKNHFKIFVIDEGYHTDAMLVGYKFYFKYKSDVVGFKLRWI